MDPDSEHWFVFILSSFVYLQGTDYCARLLKFMCLGSDPGGINRRPVRVVFTLEYRGKVCWWLIST